MLRMSEADLLAGRVISQEELDAEDLKWLDGQKYELLDSTGKHNTFVLDCDSETFGNISTT